MNLSDEVTTRGAYAPPVLVVYGDIAEITNGPKAKGNGVNHGGGKAKAKGKNKAPRS